MLKDPCLANGHRCCNYASLLLETMLYGFRRTDRHDKAGGLAEGVLFFLESIRFELAVKHHTDAHLDVQRRLILLQITSLFLMRLFLETTFKNVSFSASTKISNHIRAIMTYILLLLSSCYAITQFAK